ncbi:acyl-CoA thioesterase [Sorochytrium milnesiophthora]
MSSSSPSSNSGRTANMLDSLSLERIDVNLYRCDPKNLWLPLGSRGVFGGQIIGLALVAGTRTVPELFRVHSLHSYFLLPGDSKLPIIFHVTSMRDGRSFVTRQVTAVQNGKNIFVMICSFLRGEKPDFVHQFTMPKAPSPEDVSPGKQKFMEAKTHMPVKYHKLLEQRFAEAIPVDIRPCGRPTLEDYFNPTPLEPSQLVWMRASSELPDDPAYHMCVAAYCSDHQLLWTTLRPHAVFGYSKRLAILTSLDHSMWFHEDFRADNWMLYEMESPRTSGWRGLALGRLWTRDGKLAVSCAQEGLLRATMNPPAKSLTPKAPEDEQETKAKL